MAYTLKNPAIAQANPGAVANRAYIDALYEEAYGRRATDAEYKQFSNRTVKDAANLILGQTRSPFASGQAATTPSPQPSTSTATGATGTTGNEPSSTPTKTNTLKAYDPQGNVVYVQPGVHYTGISLYPPGSPQNAAAEAAKNPPQKPSGVPDAVWNGLSDSDKAIFAALNDQMKNNAVQGNPNPVTLDSTTMNQLLQQAKQNVDPYFAQQLQIGEQQFMQQMQSIQQGLSATQTQQSIEMLNAQKNLREQYAAQGAAQSGFRQQAQQQLNQGQTAVIQSTAQKAKDQLNQMASQFEQQYGSAALAGLPSTGTLGGTPGLTYNNPLTGTPYSSAVGVGNLDYSYTPLGGITGANVQNQLMAEQQQQNLLAQNALMTANPKPVQ